VPLCIATAARLTHGHTVPLGAQTRDATNDKGARARILRNTRIGLQRLQDRVRGLSVCRTTANRPDTRDLEAQRALRGSKQLLRQYLRRMEVRVTLRSNTSSSTNEAIAGYQSTGPQNQSQWAAPAANQIPNPQWSQPQQPAGGEYYPGTYGNQVLAV
jgi:hypothetical protein